VYLPTTPILWCDNVSTLALASYPVYHARTKHIKVDYHFILEKVLNGDIVLKLTKLLTSSLKTYHPLTLLHCEPTSGFFPSPFVCEGMLEFPLQMPILLQIP
jgi:hypothetical protein